MLVRFRLDCHHKRVSRSIPRVFAHNYVQQVGTYIQDAHSSPSIKGKSRSASKKELFIMLPIQIMSLIQILPFRLVLPPPKRIKYRLVVP